MKRILVVGLAVILGAAAGNAGTVGTNGGKGDQSSTSTTTTSNTSSSGNGTSHPAAVAPSSASGRAPMVHSPANVRVPTSVPAKVGVPGSLPANVYPASRIQRRFLDRSEILARQGIYLNQNRVSSASVDANTQNPAGTGQLRGDGQIDTPDQALGRTRHHRGDQNGSPDNDGANGTNATNGTGGKRHPTGNTAIPATNSGLHRGKPVVSFNNSNTMNFTDACRRHHDHHDRDWWRNHCHTIILIGGGFYAWDLGYWYPAYGYDPYYSNYAYNGPIYGYDGLPPDQIIANVQYALQQLGYFSEAVDGVLGPVTQAAIEDYQVENNLPVTGAVDRPLLISLGFIY